MTDIEEKLIGILTAEADRYDVPVFSAQRIAENAVRKGFWRQRRVLLIAAIGLAGLGGAGGVVVSAAGHGEARVTVTIREDNRGLPSTPGPVTANPEEVRQWVLDRTRAAGLRDVEVTVHQTPFAIALTGRASDAERMTMLGMPANLFFGEMGTYSPAGGGAVPPSSPASSPASSPCVEKQPIGPDVQICDENGHRYDVVGIRSDALKVAAVQAVRRGTGPRDWAVVIHLDRATTGHYSVFNENSAVRPERITVQAGQIALVQLTAAGQLGSGVIESAAAFTEQQAKDLAVDLLDPAPPGDLPAVLTTTVTPAAGSH
jgi:hypothetical protein